MTIADVPTYTVVLMGERRIGLVGPVEDLPGVAYTLHERFNRDRRAAGLPPLDATHVVPEGTTHAQAAEALRTGRGPASWSGFSALRGR